MKKIIIVAHGLSKKGASHPNIKTITKAEQPLSFQEGIEYMNGKVFPEYSSASMSEFSSLSDEECLQIFGKIPQGTGIVNTGIRRGGCHGDEVFVLRNCEKSLPEIGIYASNNKVNIIMLACRTY
ncbi:hypothetical protein [Treponema sp.]|uniref:hypothetical protein n=1 Tax=Treponema sp. TaxID=166 RepID=UPI003F011D63